MARREGCASLDPSVRSRLSPQKLCQYFPERMILRWNYSYAIALVINACKKFNDDRNMFCRRAFSVNDAGEVTFEYVNNKGVMPVSTWSKENFDEECKKLASLERKVSNLYPGFRPVRHILRAASLSISSVSVDAGVVRQDDDKAT